MTLAAAEVPAFTYATLDDLADEAVVAVLLYWRLRPTLPEADWLALVVDLLVSLILQAEQVGRAYGLGAVAVDGDPIFPTSTLPRRPAPDDFEQRSGTAPAPEPTIDVAKRSDELTERLTKAVATLAERIERPAEPQDVETQNLEPVERLASDEPIAATQRGYQNGIRLRQDRTIVGYRRGINPDCCELCFWLWKEGYVYPIDQPMHRHIGCRCVPVPTTDRIGWQSRDHLDDAGLAQLDRYYSGELESTTSTSNQEAPA